MDFFGHGYGLMSLVTLPIVATVVDMVFQEVRFPKIRFPDSAIATGLFVALILPSEAPLPFGATVTAAAITLRHILRYRGRPVFNPAATGALLGVVLFGLAPAWWVAVGPAIGLGSQGELVMLALGGVLLMRNWRAWRLPATFFLTYGVIAVIPHLLAGSSVDPRILLLQAIDPVTIFFGLYMVTEPRSAPAGSPSQTLYAGVVGVAAALLSWFLPSLGIFVALAIGNLLAVALRRPSEQPTSTASSRPWGRAKPTKGAKARNARATAAPPTRWPITDRVSTGLIAVFVIGAVAAGSGAGHSSTPLFQVTTPVGTAGGSAGCAHDSSAIPASTLASLHKILGPSAILAYDSATGVVTFYDPVNQVTVTETDLYEDYGYAEFNGDDYAVSGCTA